MPLWKEHSNGERMKASPLRSRRSQGCTLCTRVQHKQIEKEVNLSSFPKDKVS